MLQQPRVVPVRRVEPLILVTAPTRELATQIFDDCRRFCYRSMLRPCVIYGGADIKSQQAELERGCDLLIATPGRLMDFINRGIVCLNRIRFLVLDEADRMFSMAAEDVIKLMSGCDMNSADDIQICMFSATFPKGVKDLAKQFLSSDFVHIRVGRLGATTSDITQRVEWVEKTDKQDRLLQLLLDQPPTRTLVFVNQKRTCDAVDDFLFNQQFPVTSIHGERTQREREDALISFKTGHNPIMIATDVAARGMDIKGVMHGKWL